MEHRDGFFKGVRGIQTYYQCWIPEGDLKAVLMVVHGLAEHGGRYMNLVQHFVPQGYAVHALDHIGHGKSGGIRVYVDRFEDFTETLKIFFDQIRSRHPEAPVFLIGHSMGGLIGAAFLLEHQTELAGAVLSGPSVKMPDTISSATIFLGKIFSTLLPKVGLVALEAEGISRDPAVVDAYVNDPMVYTGKTTARLAAELLKTMNRVSAEAAHITLPILIIQGGADRLVDPSGAQMLYDAVSATDKTLKVYDTLYHEVFNEPEHDQVLADVEAWLEPHIKG